MPLITREVRWFFDGSLAADGAATSGWFVSAPAGGQEGESVPVINVEDWRTDRYLLLPDTDDVGVKLRHGWIEIKGRHSLIGIQRFGDNFEGEVACWTKWTLAAPEWTADSVAWSMIEAKWFIRHVLGYNGGFFWSGDVPCEVCRFVCAT